MASNTISGQVVEKETDLGIFGSLVVIFDIDPGTKPEEAIAKAPSADDTPGTQRQRRVVDLVGSRWCRL